MVSSPLPPNHTHTHRRWPSEAGSSGKCLSLLHVLPAGIELEVPPVPEKEEEEEKGGGGEEEEEEKEGEKEEREEEEGRGTRRLQHSLF